MKNIIFTGALVIGALAACSGTARAQTTTLGTGTIEVGPAGATDGSYKAGEFNGLGQSGAYAIGDIDWRGGNSGYNSEQTLRWRIVGHDLGFDTRSLSIQAAQQGTYKFNFNFGEIRRNRSDTYQTPLVGAGGTLLTLPSVWLVPNVAGTNGTNPTNTRGLNTTIGNAPFISTVAANNGAIVAPTAAQSALVTAAAAADNPLFQTFDIYTTRYRYDSAFSYNFDPKVNLDASFVPEHKSGTKPMGTVSRNTGGDIATIIPDVINSDTSQVSSSLNFKGEKTFGSVGYYGSFFHNNIRSMSWQNWATATGTLNTISSAPSNNFNQFNFNAGVNITPTTRLVANGSYARTNQDDIFISDATTPVVPVPTLNGLVVSTNFGLKFTSHPAKRLAFNAGYKYDNRDNQTPIHIFQYADAGDMPASNLNFPAGTPLGAVLAQNANANRPYSRKLNQANAEADYKLTSNQWVKLGYDYERIDRSCPGAWIDCADADTTKENAVRAEWRTNLSQDFQARVNYTYAQRRAPFYNENAFLALVPYAGVVPATATGGMSALAFMNANGWTGYGPVASYAPTTGNMNLFFGTNNVLVNQLYANNNRISELIGMRRYYVSDRNRNKLRSQLSWQANDALSFSGALDVNNDAYPDATYGLQSSKGWAVDLDGSYALPADFTFSAAYTYEDQRQISAGNSYTANSNTATLANSQPGAVGLSGNVCDGYATLLQRNNNNKIDPCLNWTANMLDRANTFGIGLLKKAGKVDLTGNVIVSIATWDNTVGGGSWVNNIQNGPGGPPTTIAAFFTQASPVPTVNTNSTEFRLSGKYAFDQRSSLRLTYDLMHMSSNDVALYEGMQLGTNGTVSTLLPTNEQPFNYNVHFFGVSYVLSF
jgi:MtrB/PioB family decaheme-associated outer membrane protein